MFVDLVLRWNTRLNLIVRRDEQQVWCRHVDDCLQLTPFIPGNTRSAVDIGSGGGFPGLVLAIATNLPFHLVESDKRKAAFLREASRVTRAPVTVTPSRIETMSLRVDLVTARAVAPLSRLLEWAHPKLLAGGICLFLKGGAAGAELAEAESAWHMAVEVRGSRTSPHGNLLRISGLAPR